MKQLLVLSGKGGTCKTTVASAFIELSRAPAFADCDVDAPNLHFVTRVDGPIQVTPSLGMPRAIIDQDLCIDCDLCLQSCRFDAITSEDGYRIDRFACEGCALCTVLCPVEAITMVPYVAGQLKLQQDAYQTLSTATLTMGNSNSGKVVTEVKQQLTATTRADFAVIDGSPGIGCPVLASMSGVDLVLVVTEPSLSGLSDLERLLQTAGVFDVLAVVCLNKADTNPDKAELIVHRCRELGAAFIGSIPFDPAVVEVTNRGQTLATADSPAGRAIREVFRTTFNLLTGTSRPA